MTALLSPKTWLIIGVAIAFALSNAFSYRTGKAVVRSEFDQYKLSAEQKRADAEKTQRDEEFRRQEAVSKEISDGQIRIAQLEAALADANTMVGGLHDAAARAASRARTASCSSFAGPSKPDQAAFDLFTGLLDRHTRELVEVGNYAEQLKSAGTACERIFDQMRLK